MPRAEMAAYEHGEGVCNQRPIACPLCSKTFTLWTHYETHKKCHQKLKQRQYPCQTCGKVSRSSPAGPMLTMDIFRYSHQPVIATCIKEYTKESDRSIARHAASISDKKLICSKFLIVT